MIKVSTTIIIILFTLLLISCSSVGYVSQKHPEPGSPESEVAKKHCNNEIGGIQAFSSCDYTGECTCDYECLNKAQEAFQRCMSYKGWKRIEY